MQSAFPWSLPKDWVVSPSIDLELKQYTLLAYLQRVRQRFVERKLYPYLPDVRSHLHDLLSFREGKAALLRTIPGDLVGFDPRTGEALHAPVPAPEELKVIDDVVTFAVPGLEQLVSHGAGLAHDLLSRIHLEPIGIQPLHLAEGWLLLRSGGEARAYSYSLPIVRGALEAPISSIRTRYITSYTLGITCTYEQVRSSLTRMHRTLPNAATFAVEADLPLPYVETLMPLAKQLVYERIRTTV